MRDHPRSRGENFLGVEPLQFRGGSSPLTRGKPEHVEARGLEVGIIPAHAGKTSRVGLIASRRRDHPRSRGENDNVTRMRVPIGGSSPLTRGKHTAGAAGGRRGGIIPAHAGKTCRPGPDPGRPRDHPRSRGENRDRRGDRDRGPGSSPLTRGKRAVLPVRRGGGGIIPAHAGKTPVLGSRYPAKWDHPRSRGENDKECISGNGEQGSSPLTRGKLWAEDERSGGEGIIPAHAGKTLVPSSWPQHSGDHPRSRGENWKSARAARYASGSSPLTRGKRDLTNADKLFAGIIPAHAGKTAYPARPPARRGDHPRSRGENLQCACQSVRWSGSSPLTRGKPFLYRDPMGRRGIIPAHAGKTWLVRIFAAIRRDHPRSRGENVGISFPEIVGWGSSPLTRGKPCTHPRNRPKTGIIPAHAGKTLAGTRPRGAVWDHPRSRGENP